MIAVDVLVPNPEHEHDPLPDQILGIALDQRAFGPRQLMAAFAAYDGRFLALTYTERTDPIDAAFDGCLQCFDSLGRGGEAGAAVVVLCDEPVEDGLATADFKTKFALAQRVAQSYGVHLVDWIACDDERFRGARLRSLSPATDTEWWDVPDSPTA